MLGKKDFHKSRQTGLALPGIFFIVCIFMAGCDSEEQYTNANLSGCYAMNNDIFHQYWFDGVSEFVDIYYTPESGTVSYSGTYQISYHELYLEYYSYDPEYHELYLYNGGFELDGTPYAYIGEECS